MRFKEGQVYKGPGIEYTINKDVEQFYDDHGMCTVSILLETRQVKLNIFRTLKNFIRIQNERKENNN